MDMGRILAVFNNLQNNNMSATPNDNFKGDQSMKKLKEGHAGHRDAYEAGDADAYYGRPSRPNKAVNGKTLWDDELTPEEQADYRRGYKENPCGRKDWGHSGYIREGFISNTLNKMAISKQAKDTCVLSSARRTVFAKMSITASPNKSWQRSSLARLLFSKN